MTDVAVSVYCNPSDVENGADDTQPHEETTDLNGEKERVQVFVSDCVGYEVTGSTLVVN